MNGLIEDARNELAEKQFIPYAKSLKVCLHLGVRSIPFIERTPSEKAGAFATSCWIQEGGIHR